LVYLFVREVALTKRFLPGRFRQNMLRNTAAAAAADLLI
jgi:hypothetical protein